MKITLSPNRVAHINVRYDENTPERFKNTGGKWRSVSMLVRVYEGGQFKDLIIGMSYCSPRDQFEKRKGRAIAAKRIFETNRIINLLSKEECRKISPILIYGHKPENKECDMRYLVMVERDGREWGIDDEGKLYSPSVCDLQTCPMYTKKEAKKIAKENGGRVFKEEEIWQ